MKLILHSKKKKIFQKKKGFNVHHYWTWALSFFILIIAAELFYFSWFFLTTAQTLDAPPTPTSETNARQIERMNKMLKTIEDSIEGRIKSTSQNSAPVVQ